MGGKLPSDEQRLASATKRAVQAAGGLKICAPETGLSDSQISRCCSPILRDSITIRDAVSIDAIGHGVEGHPFILNAMASIVGAVVIMQPEALTDDRCLQMSVLAMSIELGDVSRAVSDAIAGTGAAGAEVTPAEAAVIREKLRELDRASGTLRHRLDAIVKEGREPSG